MPLPPPLSWFYDAWMEFSKALGMVMSWIILTILWIVGFGAYAIVMKVMKLFTKRTMPPSSYWIDASPETDLRRQF